MKHHLKQAIYIAAVASVVLLAYNKVPAFARLVGNPGKAAA